jgi:ATP synthase protein I
MPPPEPKGRGPWRQLGFVLSIAFVFPAALLVGYLIGAWLDSKLGTTPWLSLLFIGLGFVAALKELFRELKRLNRE